MDETVTKGPLTGLGGNFGVRFVGTTAGDPANTIIVPTYTLVDASLRYDYKKLRFQINATNIADKTYVAVCQSASYCNYGYRRNVVGSIRYRWSSWRDMF
jgi:iron complex outermembrane receptor protein